MIETGDDLMNPLVQVLEHANLSEATKRNYRRAATSFLLSAGPQTSDWTPAKVIQWRDGLLVSGKRAQRVNGMLTELKAVSRRWASVNLNPLLNFAAPVDAVRVPATAAKVRGALTQEQAAALLSTCRMGSPIDLRDYAIIQLGLRTGMRRSSMCILDFEEVDWSSGVMNIWIKGNRRLLLPPVGSVTMAALAPWRSWLARHGVASGRVFRSFSGCVDLGGSVSCRAALTPDGVYKIIRRRAVLAGLGAIAVSPHIFRHTFVTWLAEAGVDDRVIAAYTGHVGGRMVQHYTDARQIATRRDPLRWLPDLGLPGGR